MLSPAYCYKVHREITIKKLYTHAILCTLPSPQLALHTAEKQLQELLPFLFSMLQDKFNELCLTKQNIEWPHVPHGLLPKPCIIFSILYFLIRYIFVFFFATDNISNDFT